MPVFHARTDLSTTEFVRRRLERLEAALGRLSARGLAAEDFEGFERECHALFAAAEREVPGGELEALDIDRPGLVIEGRRRHRVLRSSETYTSAAGPVTVRRTLYRAGSGRAVVPLELRAGIVAGHWTPLAARQASFLVSHPTPQESEDMLKELGNMTPSKSRLDRLPKRLSARREAERERFEAALRALPIGFGVVEAACKTLATQRLKRSGMRWRNDGGQAILTLRGWVQSHRFDQAWQLLSETYRAEISLPDNVTELPCNRAA